MLGIDVSRIKVVKIVAGSVILDYLSECRKEQCHAAETCISGNSVTVLVVLPHSYSYSNCGAA